MVGNVDQKRAAIEPDHPELSVARQCALVGLARASYYYQPVAMSAEELVLLRRLDEQYTRTPFYGVRRMTAVLRQRGYAVNPNGQDAQTIFEIARELVVPVVVHTGTGIPFGLPSAVLPRAPA